MHGVNIFERNAVEVIRNGFEFAEHGTADDAPLPLVQWNPFRRDKICERGLTITCNPKFAHNQQTSASRAAVFVIAFIVPDFLLSARRSF